MENRKERFGLSGSTLKIIAMVLMVLDHAYTILFPNIDIFKAVGRLSFPIFCFMIVEGFRHTKNIKRYMARLAVFGVISEVPFNLMASGNLSCIRYQNVMWTMLLGLFMLQLIKECKGLSRIKRTVVIVMISLIGFYLGEYFGVDYGGFGVLQIILFYVVNDKEPIGKCFETAGMVVIHSLLPSRIINIGMFSFRRQQLGLLSLPFIWLYNGKRGMDNKYFQYTCYWFYPVHIMVLVLIKFVMGGIGV